MVIKEKALFWEGDSLAVIKSFPGDVRKTIGYALFLAQIGQKHPDAKPLKGFRGAGVIEVVTSFDGNAYRAVYTVTIAEAVYVLHAFQKKSPRGIKTPRQHLEIITRRYKALMAEHRRR